MKKFLKVLIGIIVILIICFVVVFLIDYIRVKNAKEPIFKFRKYEKIAIIEHKDNTYIANENYINNAMLIKVNGKVYIYNGKTNSGIPRCGMMDGKIASNVKEGEMPTENNQSNFDGEYSYQYGSNDTIELYKDDNWLVFEILDSWAEKNLVTLEVYSIVAEDLAKEFTLSKEDSLYLIGLTNRMQCRNYTCDGIASYHFKIDNQNYGVEIYENEIHILPYSDSISNEAIITGKDYTDLKAILDQYPVLR